jgi:hypothetical protein
MRINLELPEEKKLPEKLAKKKKKKEKMDASEDMDPEDFVQSLKNHPAKTAYLEKKKLMDQEFNFKNPKT